MSSLLRIAIPLMSAALLAFSQAEGARSVVDLGCGMGSYVQHFKRSGMTRAAGFDGNPATPKLSKVCVAIPLMSSSYVLPSH